MAQLGNLLVKGSSRFLNKAYFEDVSICGDVSIGGKLDITANEGKSILSLNGKKALEVYDTWLNINESRDFPSGIYCGTGVLRTDGEFQVSNIKTGVKFKVNNSSLASNVPSIFSAQTTFNGGLIANSANISEEICNTLIVKDELRSAKWNIDNITNLGSTFYVSPCIVFTNPSVYVNSISGTTVVLTITDNSITSSTIGGATWTNGSKIKLMGRIGNSALGTINGVLKRDLNSSTAKTAYISLDFPNTDLIKFSAGATYSGSNVGDLKMMMYEVNKNVNGTTKNRPIGILLSSYGENKKPCIDIYNGDIEDGSPVARMGYLNGLPSVNGENPTGYGFYAAGNAYFSGTLVSGSGKIGGFEISQYKMVNDSGNGDIIGICSTGGQEWAIWTGASKGIDAPFHVGHNGYLYASNATIAGNITATSGKIGKYTITNNFLITGNNSTCTGMGGNQAFWAGSDSSNDAPFRVGYDGSFYSSKGIIAGWNIGTDNIYSYLGNNNKTSTITLHSAQSTTAPYITLERNYKFSNGDYSNGKIYIKDEYISFHADIYTQNSEEKYSSELIMRPLGNGIYFWKEGSNMDGDFCYKASYNVDYIELYDSSLKNTKQKITAANLNACHAGLVCRYWNANTSITTNTNNTTWSYVPAFVTTNDNNIMKSEFFSKVNNNQIKILKKGIYQFFVRIACKSSTAFKRALFAPYINNKRYSSYTDNIYSPVVAIYQTLKIYTLELVENDLVDFRAASQESIAVQLQINDINIFVIDYEGKYS